MIKPENIASKKTKIITNEDILERIQIEQSDDAWENCYRTDLRRHFEGVFEDTDMLDIIDGLTAGELDDIARSYDLMEFEHGNEGASIPGFDDKLALIDLADFVANYGEPLYESAIFEARLKDTDKSISIVYNGIDAWAKNWLEENDIYPQKPE